MRESYIRLGLGGRHAVVDVVVCWASCWEDYEGRKEGILHFIVSIPAQAIDAHGNGNGTLAFLLFPTSTIDLHRPESEWPALVNY